ncbi:hypothetical protein SAMN06296386_102101 [Lachnospiraceae bacterium]|nr:hypothetical protein SAMN06296386_102101 [Lachnospiraceae bacterium]
MNKFFRKLLVVKPKNYIRFSEFMRKISRKRWVNIKVDADTITRFRINRQSIIDENLRINERSFKNHVLKDGYIEDQEKYTDMRYGTQTVQYSGCQVIAVFNLLRAIGRSIPFTELLSIFEKDGVLFGGEFGTSPKAAAEFFTRIGLGVETSFNEEQFSEIAERSKAMILTAYNDCTDIMKMAHTICVTKSKDGYRPHNSVKSRDYESIIDLIREINGGERGKGIYLIGVTSEETK